MATPAPAQPEVKTATAEEMEHYLTFPDMYCRRCEGGCGPLCIDCANADDHYCA